MEEKVMHLMRRGVITCSEETNLQEVAQIMVANSIRYCVVTNPNNEVKGFISTRLMLKGYKKDLEQGRAKDILLPYTITITPSSSLKEAVRVMNQKRSSISSWSRTVPAAMPSWDWSMRKISSARWQWIEKDGRRGENLRPDA